LPGFVADLVRICGELATLVEKLPCVARMREDGNGQDGYSERKASGVIEKSFKEIKLK